MLKLYLVRISPCCRAVWLYCLQNNLQVELVDVDIFAGELKSPEFLALNPHGEVPLLVDGERKVADAVPILNYLAERYTGHAGFGPTNLQPEVKSLLSWTHADLHKVAGYGIVYPNFIEAYQLQGDHDATEALIERSTIQLTKQLETLEKCSLTPNKFLTGENITIADFYVATVIVQLEWVNFDLKLWPRLSTWLSTMKQQPHWSTVHEKHEGFVEEMKKHDVT